MTTSCADGCSRRGGCRRDGERNGAPAEADAVQDQTAAEARADFLIWMPLRAGAALVASSALVAVSIAALAAAATSLGATAEQVWKAATSLGLGVAADANWLLPTLFASILAVLAILVGQNFTDLPEPDADTNRRRLAAASWIIAGTAVGSLALSALSLANPSSEPRHLWASGIVTALIVASAFYGGTIALGSPEQQLHVIANSEADLQRHIQATPIHEHDRPAVRLFASLGLTAGAATCLAVGFAAVGTWIVIGRPAEDLASFAALAAICAVTACGGAAQAALIAQLRDNTITRWGSIVSAVPSTLIAMVPVGVLGASLPASPTGRIDVIAILGAYVVPLLMAIAPRSLWRGWTPRGGLDGLRLRRFRVREHRLECQRRRYSALLSANEHPQQAHQEGDARPRPVHRPARRDG